MLFRMSVLLWLVLTLTLVQFAASTTKLDDVSIRDAVDRYLFHVTMCEGRFANCSMSASLDRLKEDGIDDINVWDVSSVTNMSRLFSRASLFDADLSNWDISNVVDLSWTCKRQRSQRPTNITTC